jgi:hypothetical protein
MMKLIAAFRDFVKAPKNQKMETLYCTYLPISKSAPQPQTFKLSLICKSTTVCRFLYCIQSLLYRVTEQFLCNLTWCSVTLPNLTDTIYTVRFWLSRLVNIYVCVRMTKKKLTLFHLFSSMILSYTCLRKTRSSLGGYFCTRST